MIQNTNMGRGRGKRDYDQRFDHKIACLSFCVFVVSQDTSKEHTLPYYVLQLEDVAYSSLSRNATPYCKASLNFENNYQTANSSISDLLDIN